MLKGREIRLLPTPEQEKLLYGHAGVMRFAYNFCKGISEAYYKATGESLSQVDLQKTFTVIKNTKSYEFLKDYNAQVPKQASKDFEKARKASFKKYGHGFKTNFKSKKKSQPKFYIDQYSFKDCKPKEIYITSIGKIKTGRRIPRTKKLSNLRIKYDGFGWYMKFATEEPVACCELTDKVIGIDDGLAELAVCSNGMRFGSIRFEKNYKKLVSQKARYQKQMSKRYKKDQKEQSNNYLKSNKNHLRVSRKLTNIRQDHIHQATRKILNTKPKAVVVEDKKLGFMIQNRKQAKAVMSQNIHEFMRQLKYKAESQGTVFHKAPKSFPSSKLCSCCGYKYEKKDYNNTEWNLNIRSWECFKCKTKHDRDLNASYNLRNLYV